ncbi:uncharacterized protein LOC111891204 [Lactuca sativa]|uniref:uncharacterized protein LOC111891204 n=1 Tax=Lactuca sativa TaxID=4236 RepID=UPI000CD86ADD|nr:uncharacterized protein LOC111891204 [Lactuca sativa]
MEDMIARAREKEIDLEIERKRKPEAVFGIEFSGKKPKVDSRGKGQQGRGRCCKCDRSHEGICRAGSSGCFKCVQTGHMSKVCTATTTTTTTSSHLICFQCNQRGHKRSQCPSMAAIGQVLALAPATLRITDGRQDRAEKPVAKRRSFQLTAEEARASPDVVTGSFLANNISPMVLFDLGVTKSFVSLALGKQFSGAPGELDCPLDVEIVDDRTVRVVRVHQSCILHLFDEQFPVDLFLIPLHGNKLIVGMDWLSPNGVVIDCEQQLVRVRTPSREGMVIQGERPQGGLALCFAARARLYLQQGYTGYVAYVMDTQYKCKGTVDDVPIVQ